VAADDGGPDVPPGERRGQKRLDIPLNLVLRYLDEGGRTTGEEQTIADNVSRGGARVLASRSLEVGAVVRVAELGGDFETRAVVRGQWNGDDRIPRLNLQFLDRPAPVRLADDDTPWSPPAIESAGPAPPAEPPPREEPEPAHEPEPEPQVAEAAAPASEEAPAAAPPPLPSAVKEPKAPLDETPGAPAEGPATAEAADASDATPSAETATAQEAAPTDELPAAAEEPAATAEPTPEPEPRDSRAAEPVPPPATTPLPEPSGPPPAAPAPAAEPSRELNPETAALRDEVLRLSDGLKARSFYELLGLPRTAGVREITAAYAKLARRFHPDRIAQMGLPELKQPANALFIRLGEARETLCDSEERAWYDRKLASGNLTPPMGTPQAQPKKGTGPITLDWNEANDIIAEGRELLQGESYWDAIQKMEAAIPLVPEKPQRRAMQVILARATVKNPKWVKRGEELLRHVVNEDPRNVEALLALGQIYRDGGLRVRAARMYSRVLEIERRNEDARKALAELEGQH
jgi:hypothetical protein